MFSDSIYTTAYASQIGIVFAACKNGRLLMLEDQDLSMVCSIQAHFGAVEGISICEKRKLVALVGGDRHISLFKYDSNPASLEKLSYTCTRDLGLNDFPAIHSVSQAVDISPTKNEIATRGGNSSLIFIDFEGNQTHSLRLHNSDIITVKYSKCGSYLMVGGNHGEITIVSDYKVVDNVIPEGIAETMHWFEEVSENFFVIACDARKIVSVAVDPETLKLSTAQGDSFTRDDLEHVTYKQGEKYALATSFDRHVYKVDIDTLQNIGVCYEAEYKLRWIDYHRSEPDVILLQVRNGSLQKINIATGEVLRKFHKMPPTIWSCEKLSDGLFLAVGEEGAIINIEKPNANGDLHFVKTCNVDLKGGYFKRLCIGHENEFAAGSTKGHFVLNGADGQEVIDVGSPVRDICYSVDSSTYYLCLEDGRVVMFSSGQIQTLWQSEEPIWSLALNPAGSILAFGERMGQIYLMDVGSRKIIESTFSRLPKRMKWVDNNTLYCTYSDSVDKIYFENEQWNHSHRFIDPSSNTVEDFVVWDGYMVMITYANRLWLADTLTGEILDSTFYGSEYMKSIVMTSENSFTILGRSGCAMSYRIDCDQLLSTSIDWYKDDI
ncbi:MULTISPECIES: WD40 repeat domain-containing protein [unclassified Vibrio]|uniref:WD40 repeat domain-containing protein n=1 Tax=unclassified Vibrio TaxID=2614977 RepID=UPI000B8E2971|nr:MULTISPECIES: WD40 repeat domain-containing protein [unclassified Vibrio]NAX17039.1 hypothetical protein [Vibrio sp. V22_P2S10T140]OXX43279.1 hypothetical protein B9J83_09545 [Vibrio sp. V07_P2A8T137]OXX57546.1 hypothetical protein B9J82_09940 [Vibrio sp. V10_P2A27P122]PSD43078.1 WD40 repeat domain-containing protein [Vibrio sp. V02_P2A34T13]